MKKGGFFLRGARKLNNVYETELERRDPIYLEPLHRKSQDESKAPAAVKRGGIDVYFLIIVIALCMFGTVMVYSASAYTAELEFGDNLYYVKRHIIFIAVAMGLSAVFIALAKPGSGVSSRWALTWARRCCCLPFW